MALDTVKNFAYATLAAGIAADATSLNVTSGHGARLPSTAFDAVIWDLSYPSPTAAYHASAAEVVRVTARSTDALTITRAQDDSTARAFNTNGRIYAIAQVFTKGTFDKLAPKSNAALTETTTVDAINPNVADLGTVASGTITLSTTKAVNKVVASGSAATVALPATPIALNHILLVETGASVVTFTVPSLPRDDGDGVTEVTSVQFAANATGALTFRASGGAFIAFSAPGSIISIASSALAGFSTGDVAEGSTTKFPAQSAVVSYTDARLDAFTLPYTDVIDVPEGSILGRYTTSTGACQLITVGAGLVLNTSTGVLSATNTGSSTPVEVSGTDVDWSDGGVFYATRSSSTTYTFSNTTDGQTIRFLVTTTGNYTIGWPSGSYGSGVSAAHASTTTAWYTITRVGAIFIVSRSEAGMVIDVSAPTLSSATINTDGDELTLAFNEAVSVGSGGSAGWTLSMSGGAATITYASGTGTSSLVYTISRAIDSAETGTVSYTQPGDGIEDASGNDLATIASSSVTNNSTVTSLLVDEDFEGTGTPSGFTAGTGSPDFDYVVASDLSAGSGNQCLRVNQSFHAPYVAFTAQDTLWVKCRFRAAGAALPIRIRNGGATELCYAQWIVNGANYDCRIYGGTNFSTSFSVAFTPNTTYTMWLEYKKGTGSNAEARVWLSTSGTFPGYGSTHAVRTTGNATAQANRVYISPATSVEHLVDDLQISATQIP